MSALNLSKKLDPKTTVMILFRYQASLEYLGNYTGQPSKSHQNSRSELEKNFARGDVFQTMKYRILAVASEESIVWPCMLYHDVCPPACQATLDSLQPLSLDQLLINKVATGSVIVVRTFTNPNYNCYLCTAVEDTQGAVDCIILQNRDHDLTAEETLPKGIVMAIKEPHYVVFMGGQRGILINHPSNLIELDISSNLYPTQWREELLACYPKGAVQLKEEGNNAVNKKQFMSAARLYSMAVSVCTATEDALKRDVFRNRALAHLSLGRFEQALSDALASVHPSDAEKLDETRTLHQFKAYYRAGLASYQLGRFEVAMRHFVKALSFKQSEEAASSKLQLAMKRVKEERTGTYDFETINNSVRPSHPHVDAANFCQNTQIVDFGKPRGRGLVATKDISTGELVMCEKAYAIIFDEGDSEKGPVNVNWPNVNQKATYGTLARLPMMLMHKMLHNNAAAAAAFRLHTGSRKMPSNRPVDARSVVDGLAVHAAVTSNAFSMMRLRSSELHSCSMGLEGGNDAIKKLFQDGLRQHCGVWPHASTINHACNANSKRSYLGDLMIIRATKDIKKGDEITIAYVNLFACGDTEQLRTALKQDYKFQCQCIMCEADDQCPPSLLTKRAELQAKFYSDFAAFMFNSMTRLNNIEGLTPSHQPDTRMLQKFENYRRLVESTYPNGVYGASGELVPRTSLSAIDFACAKVCDDNDKGQPRLLLKWALRCMQDSGIRLAIDETKGKLTWDTSASIDTEYNVEAALYACLAFKRLKNPTLAKQFRELAHLFWKINTGTLAGFNEKFPHAEIWN
ncbi:hypothetical protein PG990_014330 [Apiospora arundinis]